MTIKDRDNAEMASILDQAFLESPAGRAALRAVHAQAPWHVPTGTLRLSPGFSRR